MGTLITEIDNAPKAQRLPVREERKIRLSSLTDKQKSILGAASAGVAGVSLGVVAMTLMGATIPSEKGEVTPTVIAGGCGSENMEVVICTDAPFAKGVNDGMSFTEAFKTSRAEVGAGGIFEWNGNLYNTYYKEEWDNMDKSDKIAFFESIDKDFLAGDEDKENELTNILNDVSDRIDDTEDIVILDDTETNGFGLGDEDEILIVGSEDDEDEIIVIGAADDFSNDIMGNTDDVNNIDGSLDDDIILIDEV